MDWLAEAWPHITGSFIGQLALIVVGLVALGVVAAAPAGTAWWACSLGVAYLEVQSRPRRQPKT